MANVKITEKTGGKIASCQMQKGEYTKPEMSTETI